MTVRQAIPETCQVAGDRTHPWLNRHTSANGRAFDQPEYLRVARRSRFAVFNQLRALVVSACCRISVRLRL
jgi:hypothetical protein